MDPNIAATTNKIRPAFLTPSPPVTIFQQSKLMELRIWTQNSSGFSMDTSEMIIPIISITITLIVKTCTRRFEGKSKRKGLGRKIIMSEIVRRRVLEAEVRRELMMEREMALRRGSDGIPYGSSPVMRVESPMNLE